MTRKEKENFHKLLKQHKAMKMTPEEIAKQFRGHLLYHRIPEKDHVDFILKSLKNGQKNRK